MKHIVNLVAAALLAVVCVLPVAAESPDTVFYGNIPMRWGDKIDNRIDSRTDYGETITYVDNDGNQQTLGSSEFDALARDEWDYIVSVECCDHGPFHYGMWAEEPNGNPLFAIEMDPALGTHAISGVPSVWDWYSNVPKFSGRAKYDGGIVGTHLDGAHFEGSVFADVDLDEMESIELAIHNFYEGHFPEGFERSYEIPLTSTINGETVPGGFSVLDLDSSGTVSIYGLFYGDNIEGIAGTLTDEGSDIRFSIFGATRRGE